MVDELDMLSAGIGTHALIWGEREELVARLRGDLQQAGWQVEHSASSEEAAEIAARQRPELIIVCFVGQPAPHAGRITQKLRGAVPRRELTVIGVLEPWQVRELEPMWGLDTFLIHPYNTEELLARIQLVRWRSTEVADGLIKAGPLVIDPLHYTVTVSGRLANLTAKEYELLRLLVEGRGRVFTREQVLASVWGEDYFGGERTIDVHIRRLRAKLPEIAERIVTVHGVGYRFGNG